MRLRSVLEPPSVVCKTRWVPLRAAAICGLLAPVSFILGLVFGDLAQSDDFSPANDNISDIGAQTADRAWLYNQIAANLNGLLIVAFALGLWRALGSGWLARLGVLGSEMAQPSRLSPQDTLIGHSQGGPFGPPCELLS